VTAVTAPSLPVLPDRIRQAREIADLRHREREYRAALEQDVWLFDNLADSIGIARAGQAARARLRAGELRELLNATRGDVPDVPTPAGNATCPRE
jgi:hypothetical protein